MLRDREVGGSNPLAPTSPLARAYRCEKILRRDVPRLAASAVALQILSPRPFLAGSVPGPPIDLVPPKREWLTPG
jgi:hypothetical protein